jgi:hypothetical protein
MRKTGILIAISALATSVLFGALILLALSACDGPHCCPRIDADSIIYPSVICAPDCPGGGELAVMGTATFRRGEEFCDPDKFRIYIYDVTNGRELPPLKLDKAKPGVYSFKQILRLDTNTEFEVRAVGDKECGVASHKFTVTVLKKGEITRSHLVWTGQKSWPLSNLEWKKTAYFGPGTYVDKVANMNGFTVEVDHAGLKAELVEAGAPGTNTYLVPSQDKIEANGDWTVRIPSETEYKKYSTLLGKPPIKIDVDVRCDCP